LDDICISAIYLFTITSDICDNKLLMLDHSFYFTLDYL